MRFTIEILDVISEMRLVARMLLELITVSKKKLAAKEIKVLRVLIAILDNSGDPRTLAVACYDISQFIQYHPIGRGIVLDLKGKERIMKHMDHESSEVRKNALLCVQKLFLSAKYVSYLQS
ncbi:hypothetical protein SUGI_0240080 [Cryptomeria japonica]|nr:hypothetical protein SUGI_0240080 [Cryptomeria japonica]